MDFTPVGHIQSAFKFKNGTPRQPTVCQQAVAQLTINTDVYNNPEHSLDGLDQFSHVWVIFVFHKNNNTYIKPKVKPPRLNGAKVGVFSTRSPYRLNPIGLTLAKIESVQGATIHLSGVDMLDGTPVIDLKPYIPLYDKPKSQAAPCQYVSFSQAGQHTTDDAGQDPMADVPFDSPDDNSTMLDTRLGDSSEGQPKVGDTTQACGNQHPLRQTPTHKTNNSRLKLKPHKNLVDTQGSLTDSLLTSNDGNSHSYGHKVCVKPGDSGGNLGYEKLDELLLENNTGNISSDLMRISENQASHAEGHVLEDCHLKQNNSKEHHPKAEELEGVEYAAWIKEPPYQKLTVRFTHTAEQQLERFSTNASDERYQLQFLKSVSEAKKAITDILEADPRSSYRRKKCVDRLYFFMVDVLHVTCWFNDDDHIAEVVRVKANHEKMLQKMAGVR